MANGAMGNALSVVMGWSIVKLQPPNAKALKFALFVALPQCITASLRLIESMYGLVSGVGAKQI